MVKWRRWIRPGLATTFVLAVVTVVGGSGWVARDLAARVDAQLAAGGQTWARVGVSGRNVTLTGIAPSPESQAIAMQSAGTVAGVRVVVNHSELLPVASPYVWSAKKSGRSVSVSGSVPSEAFRNSVLAATRRALPDAEIHDSMQLARGEPSGFNGGVAFALQRLAGLAVGMTAITDDVLSFTGTAASPATYRAARDALTAGMPPGMMLGPVDIAPARADPFVWSADFDGKSITLAGFVPDELVQDALIANAKKVLPETPVLDKTEIASGAPDGFSEAANYALSALTRFSQGGVALDGLRLDVAGTARSVEDYEAVIGAFAGGLPSGVTIVSSALAPARVSPYGWKGEKTEGAVTLTGYVPSAEQKSEIMAMARSLYGELRIVDQVHIAAGEPRMDWFGAIKFAMGQLQGLARGSVSLGDKTYSVDGEAASSEAYAAILDTNRKTLPASLALASARITPPTASPYRFLAMRQPAGIVLEGYVTSEDERTAILTVAKRKFGGGAIVDHMAYANGAPEGYVDAATVAMQAVTRMAAGRAELVNTDLALSGGAYYPAAEQGIVEAAAEALPKGFAATASIRAHQTGQPVAPERCRDLLSGELQAGRIDFDSDKTEVAERSFGMLDRVAAVLQRCRTANIEIASHTDADGSTARNQSVSEARANAIVEYLVDAGVMRERLTARGFGETKPIADNKSDEGKARNRRIEFTMTVRTPAAAPEAAPGAAEAPADAAVDEPAEATGETATPPAETGADSEKDTGEDKAKAP